MNEPYFVNQYPVNELMGNLNALADQGYEIVKISKCEKGLEFVVVAHRPKDYSLKALEKKFTGCDCHLHYHQVCDICQKIQTKSDILILLKKAYDYNGADSPTDRLIYICKIVREILEANCDKG